MKLLLVFLCSWPVWALAQGGCGHYLSDPTTPQEAQAVLAFAGVHEGDIFYDLGSGDGVFVIEAAREFHAKSTGIDIQSNHVADARKDAKSTTAKFILGDIFTTDYSDATVVVVNLGCGPDERKAMLRTCRIAPRARIITPMDANVSTMYIVKRGTVGRGWSIYRCR